MVGVGDIKFKIHKKIPIKCKNNLVIRKYKITDTELFYYYTKDPELARYMPCGPTTSLEKAKKFIVEVRKSYVTERITRFVIANAETDELVGAISIYVIDPNGIIELGYWLGKPYWGKGYMTGVLESLIDVLKTIPDIKAIRIRVDRNNIASIRVANKVGMKKIGDGDSYMIMGLNLSS